MVIGHVFRVASIVFSVRLIVSFRMTAGCGGSRALGTFEMSRGDFGRPPIMNSVFGWYVLREQDLEFNKMSEGYKKQLNEVQLELLNNRQHMINTEAQVRVCRFGSWLVSLVCPHQECWFTALGEAGKYST